MDTCDSVPGKDATISQMFEKNMDMDVSVIYVLMVSIVMPSQHSGTTKNLR